MTTTLPKGSRITGEDRQNVTALLVARYAQGESIRSMATDIGRSYGFVHGVLAAAGTPLRARGGATRGPAAALRKAALRGNA